MNVNSVNAFNQYKATNASREPKSALDKDDFLTLYIEQLKQQDPLQPMDTNQMATQMSQFSTVEQLINMNENIEKMVGNDLTSAVGYIGFKVTYAEITYDSDGNEVIVDKAGIVESVMKKDGKATLILTDGSEVPADQIIGVEIPKIEK